MTKPLVHPAQSCMIAFMIMKATKISRGGQISVPAQIRRRWNTSRVLLEDQGDRLVVHPAPDDPITAFRGSLADVPTTSEELRAGARADELASEERRLRDA